MKKIIKLLEEKLEAQKQDNFETYREYIISEGEPCATPDDVTAYMDSMDFDGEMENMIYSAGVISGIEYCIGKIKRMEGTV